MIRTASLMVGVAAAILLVLPSAFADHWKSRFAECTANPSDLVRWRGADPIVARHEVIDRCGEPSGSNVIEHMEFMYYYGPLKRLTFTLNRGDSAASLSDGRVVSYELRLHGLTDNSLDRMHHPSTALEQARAKAELVERRQKLLSCRNNPRSLIGITRTALRERCGIWSSRHATTTAHSTREQLAYGYSFEGGPFLYVYVDNGVVTAVQER